MGQPCSPDDVCSDENAQCLAGRCMCIMGFQLRNGVCRELPYF